MKSRQSSDHPVHTHSCRGQVSENRGHTSQPAPSPYLQQHPPHISLSVFSVELAQQELCREPLSHEVGHPVAIIAIEDPIQEAVVFTSSRGRRAGGRLRPGAYGGGVAKGRKGFRYSSGSPRCDHHFTMEMTCLLTSPSRPPPSLSHSRPLGKVTVVVPSHRPCPIHSSGTIGIFSCP